MRWARFDNATGATVGAAVEAATTVMRLAAPPQVLAEAQFVQAEIAAQHSDFPAWGIPVTIHFRRGPGGWSLVGVVRSPHVRVRL